MQNLLEDIRILLSAMRCLSWIIGRKFSISQKYSWKRRNILIVFSEKCRYSFLDTILNLPSGYFLKLLSNLINKILVFFSLKYIGISRTLNRFFFLLINDFKIYYLGHLENISLLSYAKLPNVITLHYKV